MEEDNDDEASDSFSTSSASNDQLCDLISHVFLPKQTPDRRNSNVHEVDNFLLESFCNSINSTLEHISFPQLSPTLLTLQKWLKIQPRKDSSGNEVQIFMQEVSNIQDGVPLPIYVENQNCTLLISKTKQGDKIQVSTYRSSLPNKMIMSHVGSPSLSLPETTEIIQNVEFLQSSAFAQHLRDLSVGNVLTQVITTKGKHNYGEMRDVTDPRLVSDWLVGLLVPVEKSKEAPQNKSFELKKKIRDQVTLTVEKSSSILFPFRRSGIYMSLKATLQLKLLDDLGSLNESIFVYKLFIIRFLAGICEKYFEGQIRHGSINMDLTSQMLAKLGGRASKLRNFKLNPEINSETRKNIEKMEKTCLEYTENIVEKISKAIKKQWNLISFQNYNFEETLKKTGKKKNYSVDLLHKIPELDNYIQKLINSPCHGLTSANELKPVDRYLTAKQILQARISKEEETKAKIWFYDTETYIKSKSSVDHTAFPVIWNILVKYVQHATEINADNPVAISQMYLVALKALHLVDSQITERHPLAQEYALGIESECLEHLLLPNQKDMQLLDNLVNYFTIRDNDASHSEVLSNEVDEDSFSVRFSQQTNSMISFRNKILFDTENGVRTKLAAAARAREACKELQRQIAQEGNCSCEYEDTYCEKCTLQQKLKKKRKSVAIYERALPSSETDQHAVIFEFLIPDDIAIWRDLLAFVKYEIFKDPIFNGEDNSAQIEWLNYDQKMLNKYVKPKLKHIQLCSTSLPISKTHYRVYQSKPDLLHSKDEEYVAYNGMTCCFYYEHVAKNLVKDNIKNACSFKIATTANSAPYANLQKYMETTSHTQNSVIAAQSECHATVSLREFIAFGSLRAGWNTQLRNLYEAIYTGSLSLNEEPVLALILQTIWQVGYDCRGQRESHIDFKDKIFATEFLDMLAKLVQINKGNYSSSMTVLVAIIITRRVADLNNYLVDKCYNLMKEWREILTGWIKKINEQIFSLESKQTLDKKTTSWKVVKSSLQKSLLETILGQLFSYFVYDSSDWAAVGRDEEDTINWFQAIFNWHEYIVDKQVDLSIFVKHLASLVTVLPCKLSLEMHRKLRINKSLNMKGLLQKFMSFHTNIVDPANLMYSLKGDNILVIECHHNYKKHTVTFDLQFGTFLVNGQYQSTLPENIKESKLFKRYFKNTETLQVRQEHSNIFSTAIPFHENHYKFYQIQTGDIVIQEIPRDSSELYLLDTDKFAKGRISNYYISNYKHWYNPAKKIIYFSPNNTWQSDNYEYQLLQHENSTWLFSANHTDHRILSIYSEEFKRITNILKRLDRQHYINVTLDNQNVLTAHLWRHNLKFIAKASGLLESVEYPGFTIHKNQFIKGTLVGLRQVLLLQNKRHQILLIPHSTINVTNSDDNHHQITSISLDNLKQPPYFVYEMDTVLKQLKPQNSKTAWLYLAALHAVTSSPLPDPFTQVTGTEMAVRMLQSACVWSCDPYEDEALSILKYIRRLSPVRKYYGLDGEKKGQIETIKWPEGVSSLGAYDGYDIIVSKLIEDNKSLYLLHKKVASGKSKVFEEEEETIIVSPETLRLRAYFRSLRFYNSAVAVNKEIFFSESQLNILENDFKDIELHLKLRQSLEDFDTSGLLEISWIRWKRSDWSPRTDGVKAENLSDFLLKDEPLEPPFPEITLEYEDAICDLFHLKFRENWLKLYEFAMTAEDERYHQLTIILAALALNGGSIQQLINLHYISTYPQFPEVFPLTSVITNPTYDFDEETVKTILNANAKPFIEVQRPIKPATVFLSIRVKKTEIRTLDSNAQKERQAKYEKELKEYELKKEKYMAQIPQDCAKISQVIKTKYWPSEILSNEAGSLLEEHNIQSRASIDKINKVWSVWYQNYKLNEFIEHVDEILDDIHGLYQPNSDESDVDSDEDDNDSGERNSEEYCGKTKAKRIFPCSTRLIKIENYAFQFALLKINDFLEENSMSSRNPDLEQIYTTGQWQLSTNMLSISKQSKLCQQKITKIIDDLTRFIKSQHCSGKIMYSAGITPRLDPVSILINLMKHSENQVSDVAASYFGALGVLWSHLKRINRLSSCKTDHDKKRELENPGHVNWSPKQYPQWLIIELELNIMIRPIQVDIANQMINMPDGRGGNGVTQLNMGEGKTSVIVPMLCSTLAQRNSQLCRVTVLSSMFKMNLNSLTFSIGGPILNRRVYTFKCKRDTEIDEMVMGTIKEIYEECLKLEGVVLTLPEHRLSFRLLAYDKMLKEEVSLGMKILDVENWLRKYARDVLDESDELFSVKYQLVYTVGKQVQIDGREMRWLTCQKILEHVQSVLNILFEEEGPGVVEFDKDFYESRPHQFSPVRLLDQKGIRKFLDLMVDKVLGEFTIGTGNIPVLKSFLVGNAEISREDHEKVMQVIFKESPDELQKILMLSGYLRREVLCLALMKRWRVEYGINPKQGFRKMAVPFRAKDVAAEKTEFGHPDLAIILTHLSYYYSGLDETQLEHVFEVLKKKKEPEAYYSRWISKIPTEQVQDSISSYKSINMKDAQQRYLVFEMLKKHKTVIDFWLAQCVFLRECVQFPGKLVMTPWDLCYERQCHPVTGFSGTNDSSILLPLMISQQDLPKLLDTNQKMEEILSGPENCNHKGFKMGVKCKEILKTMTMDGLTVLIDAGALMLEYTNEQVAQEWLEENQKIEAVVYFNQSDELVVKCRGTRRSGNFSKQSDISFGVSPYQGRLDKCGVFLDDQHTRGTDLKFPLGTKACVTIASKMKRDKLIQACMRMRKLGQGHTVTFYLSHDAYNKVMGQYETGINISKFSEKVEQFPKWEICAEILKEVPKVAKLLVEKYGPDVVEFHERRNCPQEFPYIRLLSNDYQNELVSMFEDNLINEAEADMLKIQETLKYVREGVLNAALMHQWLTDYGIHCNNGSRLATACQVEFENPEIAILCTYLTYYYSGLHFTQFEEVLKTLEQDPDKLLVYFEWLSVFPDDNLQEYRDYGSLQLRNPRHVSDLFEIFRKHKDVINYWLIKCVFPVELQKPVKESSALISDNGGNEITTKAVLDWVSKNTKEFNDDGLLYWALAGKNYAQRLAAEDTFHFPAYTQPEVENVEEIGNKAEILAKQCVDDEVLSLKDMYGQFIETEKLYKLVPKWFEFAKSKLQRENKREMLHPEILERFEEICEEVKERCEQNVPEKEHICVENCGMMEEEQEKELEFEKETEVEEERHNVRPGKATAVVPYVHKNVKWVVMHGGPIEVKEGIERLPCIFKGTSYWDRVQPTCWGNDVFVTTEFISVIRMKFFICDSDCHLRPINYVISCKGGSGLAKQFMVISQYEANELLRYFRKGEAKCTLHMFSMRQWEGQDLLLNNFPLQLPFNQEESTLRRFVVPSLLLASGNLYFENMKEQRTFVKFLGLVPKPWSEQDKEDFENGKISKTGFRIEKGEMQEGFQQDPTLLVKKIVVSRHGVESEASHLMCLLNEKRFVQLKM